MNNTKSITQISLVLIFGLVAAGLVTTHNTSYAQSADEPVTVYVGVLTLDAPIEMAAIQQSVDDINNILMLVGAQWNLEAVYSDDDTSLVEFITESQEDGIMVFVGPGDVANLLRAKEVIADTGYNAIYMGCCVPATHHDVLESDDNVFVLAPDILDQAAAIAAAMEAAGIEYAIPVHSGDLQSIRMRASIASQFDGVMDLGVLMPHNTFDYTPVVSAVSDKIEHANDKTAVLVLEPDDVGALMVAGSTLSDITWFGTSSELGLPVLNSAQMDFAEHVDYMVPMFGAVHESRLMVNLLYPPEARSAYDAIQIAVYALANPTVDFVSPYGRWTPLPVQAPQTFDAKTLAAVLPMYAAGYGSGTASMVMNPNGGMESAAHLIYSIADRTWVKEAVYNPSLTTVATRVTNGYVGDFIYTFEPTHKLHDVHTVGALLPLSGSLGGTAEQRLTAARVALSTANSLNHGNGNDWYVDLHIEDTQTDPDVTLEKIKRLDRLGVSMVVGPSASSNAAAIREYAQENNIVLLSPSTSHALSIPDDSLYRVSPPSIHEVAVLTDLFEQDGIEHVVAIYREDLWGSNLIEGLLSEFGGTINTENGYSPVQASKNILEYNSIAADVAEDVMALVEVHDESTVAVVMIGFEESAGILEAATLYPSLGSVQWYGSAGNTNRLAILTNDVALAFAESVDYRGPVLMIDDGIEARAVATILQASHIDEHLDPYTYVTYDAVTAAIYSVGHVAKLPASEAGPVLSSIITNVATFITNEGGLDENGDLADADYDIWQIKDGGWQNILVYDSDREKFLREAIVGAPVELTGPLEPPRIAIYWLAEIAANMFLTSQDADWRLVLSYVDTAGNPQLAQEAVKSLHERGINLLLAPSDAASLDAVRPYVEENNMLIINCCATGTDSAVPDRIFRLVPDATNEAEALNTLFTEHVTEHLIMVYRDDAFGSSLGQAIKEIFEGSTVEIPYDSGLADSRMLDYNVLADQIADAVHEAEEHDESGVAVILIGYVESADIMASASEHHILESVKWYGTSGVAKRLAMIMNLDSAMFAETVNYEATLFAEPPPNPQVVGGLATLNFVPDAYTYTTFDTVLLMAAAVNAAGSDDVMAIAEVLPLVASQFPGTIGSLALNANGDLDQSVYDVWRIHDGVWELAAMYNPDEGLTYSAP